MNPASDVHNLDLQTVEGFGEEWAAFDQTVLDSAEWQMLFDRYFAIFPWDRLPQNAEGFDLGCGSGRWAAGVIDNVGTLHCVDPSAKAIAVCERRLGGNPKARFHLISNGVAPLQDASQDFGYALGVLHHVPDTQAALAEWVHKLKPGAPFLTYIYYSFENRPIWFRALWRVSDKLRRVICRLPFTLRKSVTTLIALGVYWPLARFSLLLEKCGFNVSDIPLSPYRKTSLYTMRTDALDRFGTSFERRFDKAGVTAMLAAAGLENIRFSEGVPFWVAVGTRKVS